MWYGNTMDMQFIVELGRKFYPNKKIFYIIRHIIINIRIV